MSWIGSDMMSQIKPKIWDKSKMMSWMDVVVVKSNGLTESNLIVNSEKNWIVNSELNWIGMAEFNCRQ